MSVSRIPLELWCDIFDWAIACPGALEVEPPNPLPQEIVNPSSLDGSDDPYSRERILTCSRLSLVCKTWCDFVTPRLYEYVFVSSMASMHALAQTLALSDALAHSEGGEHRVALGSRIRHLKVVVHVPSNGSLYSPEGTSQSSRMTKFFEQMETVFRRLNHLEILDISLPLSNNMWILAPETLTTTLAASCGPSLRKLAFNRWNHSFFPPDALTHILRSAPNIRALLYPTDEYLTCGWCMQRQIPALNFMSIGSTSWSHDMHVGFHVDDPTVKFPHLQRLLWHPAYGAETDTLMDRFLSVQGDRLTTFDFELELAMKPTSSVHGYLPTIALHCRNLEQLTLHLRDWSGLFPLVSTELPMSLVSLVLNFSHLPRLVSSSDGRMELCSGLAEIHSPSLRIVRVIGRQQIYGWMAGQISKGRDIGLLKLASCSFRVEDSEGDLLWESRHIFKTRDDVVPPQEVDMDQSWLGDSF